jgi:hypothetical protein
VIGIEESVEGGAADAEHFGGADLVAVAACEDADDVAKDGAVEVGIFGGDLGGSGGWRGIDPMEGRNVDGADPLARAFESRRGRCRARRRR